MPLSNINVGTVANDGTGDTVRAAFQKINANNALFAAVALSGAYGDLSGKPGLAAVALSGAYADLSGKPALATVATTGAYSDLTGKPALATVATSGSYSDLSNKPAVTLDHSAAADPGTGNDNTQGYSAGSLWINTSSGVAWVCQDASTGAAIWTPQSAIDHVGMVSGRWYSPLNGSWGASSTVSANLLMATPIRLPHEVTLTALGMRLNSGVASTNVVMGLYTNVASAPAGLIGQLSSPLSTASAVDITGSFPANITLGPGMYWIATLFSGSPAVLGGTDRMMTSQLGGGNTTYMLGSGASYCGFASTLAYTTTLPSTFTGGGGPSFSWGPGVLFKLA